MTTIHDGDPGSRMLELEGSLLATRFERDALAKCKDELEAVLGAARLGFCRISTPAREIIANSHFKADFGWPPDEPIAWKELLARVLREDRAKFADAVDSAFIQGTEIDLIVRTQVRSTGRQWLSVRGRTANSDDGLVANLLLTSQNVTTARRAAAGRQRERALLLEQERKLLEAAE